ncbi:threonine ammonia-lyase [Streptoalloteichus hindustanus]|uniref:threonine ammonia-lyase n=1 Tax=Streptoalloteichus hindustanus TaxID=2017 RepID=A0A1M5CIA5_STRHI|nr:threonine/serine dehydratase [Streptoalloteichus hindustanus]SHF54401.1 threonine dehydratase [Streptoalloteichus hindustanus]
MTEQTGSEHSPALLTMDDVRAAARRIRPHVVRTPLLPAGWSAPGHPLWLKAENLQPSGAFKLRGATNAILNLSPGTTGVVTHSSGNHGRALAHAARAAGLPATVVVPDNTPPVKIAAIRELSAQVVVVPPGDRERVAEELRARHGFVLVPPFESPAVIAGQGTVGLEIAEDLPEVATVLVPVSGAGLISGIAVALRALLPEVRIIGVEPADAADAAESLRTGHLVRWSPERTARTVADGLRAPSLGELTWAHVRQLVDDIVQVREDEILAAMRVLATQARLVAEPSGAVAAAAYQAHHASFPHGPVVAVVSGGNVEPSLLARVLTERPS